MKKIVLLALFITLNAFPQFKDSGFQSSTPTDGIFAKSNSSSGSLFGFLNSENFQMRHSYDLSYSSFGGNGLALGVYTNSMLLKVNENLNLQLDASIVHSPYNTLGKDFQKNISGIYISKAAVNFKPFKNVFVTFQYRSYPAYSNMYNPYYYGGGMYNQFEDSFYR